jgi:glycosyltransferase involved in cell wall biosynthesis
VIITFVGYNPVDFGGGGEAWLRDMASRLSSKHTIRIVSPPSETDRTGIRDALTALGIEIIEINYTAGTSLPSPLSVYRMAHVFSSSDVVYFNFATGGLEIAMFALQKFKSFPMVAGHHLIMNSAFYGGSLPISRRAYYGVFGFRGDRIARHMPAHHVLNRETEADLSSRGYRNISRIPNGIDRSLFSPSEKFERFTILFLGRLVEQKGADRLPDFYHKVTEVVDDFDFLIAGAGDYGPVLKQRLSGANVSMPGFVDEEQKKELLSRSHVLLLPSRYEMFPIAALEALSSGTPVITSDIVGTGEYLIPGENGFKAADVGEMAERAGQLYRMYLNGDYQEMSARCRRSTERFDIEKVVKSVEEMLVRIADSGMRQ